jgi:hypothetical protein
MLSCPVNSTRIPMMKFPAKNSLILATTALSLSFSLACSSSSGGAAADGSMVSGPDGGGDTGAHGDTGNMPAMPNLTGTIKDMAGVPVVGAKVEIGGAAIFSDAKGGYAVSGLPPGPAAVKVTRDWFAPYQGMTDVPAAGAGTLDVTLVELPLKVDPADRMLADKLNQSFDWTKATLSIAIVPRPTRRDFDNGLYWHNPELYRDTSAVPPLVPAPVPSIAGGAAQNFSFLIKSGPRTGQEVLEVASIVDTVKESGLGDSEPADFMLWTPMINWLTEWDPAKASDLKSVEVSVRQQNWGGNAIRPQELEKVFIDAMGRLWVKVVFASFVQVGAGINDDDGDGLKEIYARINANLYTKEIVDKLTNEYARTTFTAHGLSKEVTKSLNELYSKTAAQVERTLGQPFEVPGVGTLAYPTLVLRHSDQKKNVLLVAPGP